MPAVHARLGRQIYRPTAELWRKGRSFERKLVEKQPQGSRPSCKRRKLSIEAGAVAEGQLVQWLDLPLDKTFASEDGNEGWLLSNLELVINLLSLGHIY